MSKKLLEQITSSMVVLLVTVLTLGTILMFANLIFSWDLFPPFMEKILGFIAISMLLIIIAGTLINIMLNLSRMGFLLEKIIEQRERGSRHD
ncbi:MAG TPA: hypothetical protein DCW55_01470 [Candidatus Pacebacteria bacterium]|nr:MAG: hypothetical protein A2378_02610 [Candidatus Pacebacteria bacterium RIFOXYB1_FULL_44_10]HAU98880.1 hypothetical protein [Candidatus Paceibacterota bacterium]HAX01162.1 hypothetical protein [Candidatus Paceibacterota bacterium]